METIELSPNDKGDLLRLIEICESNPKIFKYDGVDFSKWWDIRLEQLRRVINGYKDSSVYRSSLGTLDTGKNEEKDYIRRSKELLNLEEVDYE